MSDDTEAAGSKNPTVPPPASEGANRRQSERKSLRTKGQLQFAGRPPLELRTLDVSVTGMAVVASSNLPPSAVGQLQFMMLLKKGRVLIQLNARVVHSVFSSSEGGFKVGLQFVGAPAGMMSAITQYLEGG